MKPIGLFWHPWVLTGWAILAVPIWNGAASMASAAPVLYGSEDGWAVAEGVPEGVLPPTDAWAREGDLWIGRARGDDGILRWGETVLDAAQALPLPLAPTVLPPVRNAFGDCAVRSLSIRYDSQIRSRRWALAFMAEGKDPVIYPLALNHGPAVPLAVALEDTVSGERWELNPQRMGVEGGMFDDRKGEARLYAGKVDGERIEWHVVVGKGTTGRRTVQARVRTSEDRPRLLRLRVMVGPGGAGLPVVQSELPPALVAVKDGTAVGMFVDLAEPRRFRFVNGADGWMGFEFDLAVARSTGNFPRGASASVEVDAWPTAGAERAVAEAEERLVRLGGGVPVPDFVLSEGVGDVPAYEPTRWTATHPGGFRDAEDGLGYLMLRMSGLFPDHDWASSAFLCAAQDAEGRPRMEMAGDSVVFAVNPDPDLDTMLEVGQNRGLTLLARILGRRKPAVWVRAVGGDPGLDHHARALYLCDYPAVWEEETGAIGVDLGHAEAEWIASLACVLKDRNVCLLVEDSGPLAPFTTVYADALVCASSDPAEMRRQRALAGPRPVIWTVADAGEDAVALARDLGFASPDHNRED